MQTGSIKIAFLWEAKCRFWVPRVRLFALFIWKDLGFSCSVIVSHTRRKFFSVTATWKRIPFPCPISLVTGCVTGQCRNEAIVARDIKILVFSFSFDIDKMFVCLPD